MGPLFVNPAPVRATAPRLNGVLPIFSSLVFSSPRGGPPLRERWLPGPLVPAVVGLRGTARRRGAVAARPVGDAGGVGPVAQATIRRQVEGLRVEPRADLDARLRPLGDERVGSGVGIVADA